jgi:hypothetical protein
MKLWNVMYSGEARGFKSLKMEVKAETERSAVIFAYCYLMDWNYFPEPDGAVYDQDGELICDIDDTRIEFEGGHFFAIEKIAEA